MTRKLELLAPGGDIDCIKAAILAGADAIYCGLDKFNARNRAANISFDDLKGVLRLAHKNDCQIFVTLNIVIVEKELSALIQLLNRLVNTTVDGVIVQDLGLFYLLSKYFKGLVVHASTQMTTHNEGQIKFLDELTATRVNLCRELNIDEIKALTGAAVNSGIATEVFVHGSYCISFSGLCYVSSVHTGNSGNRGRCSQPCRDKFVTTSMGNNYPLNLKDNSAFFDLKELWQAGVYSLKIEGRIKKSDYVYTVVDTWRRHIDQFSGTNRVGADFNMLYKVFNRDFSNSFLKGDICKNMFIDNPRDHTVKHLSEINDYASDNEREADVLALYAVKDEIKASVERKIEKESIAKCPLVISVSGKCNQPLKVNVKSPGNSFSVSSKINLEGQGTQPLDYDMIFKRFKAFNQTDYFIDQIKLDDLDNNVYIPFKELTRLKNEILLVLNDSGEAVEPVILTGLPGKNVKTGKPDLAVLISDPKDVALCNSTSARIYYQLPNNVKEYSDELIDLFGKNKRLIPWFPSVLIGEDYDAAVDLLNSINPSLIVTNNTGIAYYAFKKGIAWIAGPFLNTVNSYSLLCLKEKFNCAGSFISNELSREQIKDVKSPEDFSLYYSIYHPIMLMTSRQCLFQQVEGCQKEKVDKYCIKDCQRESSITNLKNSSLLIEKSKGNYNCLYNDINFLNTQIVSDIADQFTGFSIDLRDINTQTQVGVNKIDVVTLFEQLINGDSDARVKIQKIITPTTNIQYKRGI